jgi:cytochrome c-type biogenesis protein CcmF
VHLGVLVMAVAVAISSGLAIDRTVTLERGESAEIGDFVVRHDRLVVEPLPDDARVVETRAEITFGGARSGELRTALRDYPSSTTAIATPAVSTSLGEDLYVTLLASDAASGAVTLHLFVNPLVVWIWIGGAIVGIGAAFAAWPERRAVTVASAQPMAAPSAASVENA